MVEGEFILKLRHFPVNSDELSIADYSFVNLLIFESMIWSGIYISGGAWIYDDLYIGMDYLYRQSIFISH